MVQEQNPFGARVRELNKKRGRTSLKLNEFTTSSALLPNGFASGRLFLRGDETHRALFFARGRGAKGVGTLALVIARFLRRGFTTDTDRLFFYLTFHFSEYLIER